MPLHRSAPARLDRFASANGIAQIYYFANPRIFISAHQESSTGARTRLIAESLRLLYKRWALAASRAMTLRFPYVIPA
jgi:hypothetical protein